MSFPRYPTYRSSGVEWLGDLPSHWQVDRFKRSVKSSRNGIWGEEPRDDANDVPCVRVADFDRTRLVADLSSPTIRNVTPSERADRTLSQGDLLLEKSGGGDLQPVGCVVLYDQSAPAVCSNFVARVSLQAGMCPSYWRYAHAAAYAVRLNERSIKQTSGIQNLDSQQYLDERAPFPPFGEQVAIAAFLDRETAKIDALVAEQERLIELLKEKRQAVISHAVTKGLNPDAPMKPSGIEWLGDVPAHWAVMPLRHACQVRNTLRLPLDQQTRQDMEGEFPYYGPTGILSWINEYRVEGDHFLIGEDGDHFLKFANRPMTIPVSGRFNVNNHAHLVRGIGNCSTQWACRFFQHKELSPWLIKQGVGRFKLRLDTLKTIPMVVPPPVEQADILRRLDEASQTSDFLVAEANRAVALLGERRSTLVSAAVTGRIDVRGLPASAA